MAERKSWAVSASPGGEITTLDGRHALGSMLTGITGNATYKRTGRIPYGSEPLKVTATTPTPNGFVHVSPGHLVLMGTRSLAPYVCTLDAVKDLNVLSTAAHGSLARIDRIVAQQNDTGHSDADNTWTIKQFVGNPNAVPVPATVTGSPDYVVLAEVTVPAGASSISSGNIANQYAPYTVPLGGILPVLNATERDALFAYEGMAVWQSDTDWLLTYTGSAWRVIGIPVVSTSGNLSTIPSPYNGQIAWVTATSELYRYNGSAWVGLLMEAHVYQTSTHALTNGAFTSLLMQAEGTDPLGWHSTVSNTDRVIPNIAGRYEAFGTSCAAISAVGNRAAQIFKNGAGITGYGYNSSPAPTGSDAVSSVYAYAQADMNGTSDYFTIGGYQSAGTLSSAYSAGNYGSNLTVRRIGP